MNFIKNTVCAKKETCHVKKPRNQLIEKKQIRCDLIYCIRNTAPFVLRVSPFGKGGQLFKLY